MFATLYGKLLIGCLTVLTVVSFAAALLGKKSDDSYTSVVMLGLAYGLVELTWMASTTELVTFADNIVLLIGSVRILFVVVMGYLLANYIMTRNGKKLDAKTLLFTLIQVIILLDVNIFYSLLFSYSADNGLTKGSLYPVPYIFFAMYGILLLIMLLMGKKKDLMSLICAAVMIVGGIAQVLTEKVPIIYIVLVGIVAAATATLPKRGSKVTPVSEETEAPQQEEQPQVESEAEETVAQSPEILPDVQPQPSVQAEAPAVSAAPEDTVSSTEQLPEFTFDFIDEALKDESAEPSSDIITAVSEEPVINEQVIIDDIPELKQIEELIQSETFTDMPVVEQPQSQNVARPEDDIENLLNQISETITDKSSQAEPATVEPAEPPVPVAQPEPENTFTYEPVAEDTSSSLAAIQQAYDREIDADRQEEIKQQQRQQKRNERVITKPVISPLGPVERPKPGSVSAAMAVVSPTPAVQPSKPVEKPAVPQAPAAPAAAPAFVYTESIVPHVDVRPLYRPVITPSVVPVAASTQSPITEKQQYEKPRQVAKLQINDILEKNRRAEREKKRHVQPPTNLPSIEEIITASQIAHKQPEAAEQVSEVAERIESEPVRPARTYRPRRRKSMRIMIIGSMSSEVRLIADALKKEKNYRVDVIDDGYLAMELLAGPFAKVFDGILAVDQPSYSDIYATIRMVRECEISEIASLPIVCLVNDDPRRNLALKTSGVDAFVKRPLDVDHLAAVLREQLERNGW